jgi:DNA mismatch endonuclease (patch repair protein)
MPDVMTQAQRSRCMSRIRSAETGPELRLRRALWAAGLRFRVRPKLPGKPDVIFKRAHLAVFVDGCFWHGCPIHGTRPKSNTSYWHPKIERNIARDREIEAKLTAMGWCVARYWEHEVADGLDRVVAEIAGLRAHLIDQR